MSADVVDPISGRNDYNFGLSVSSPLYRGGANQARIRGAGAALGAADAAEARVRLETGRLLAEARRQVASYENVAAILDARESKMRETGKLYRLQYLQMGTRTLVDLLNAEQELHQARFDLVNTLHDLRRLEVDCLFYAGREREAVGLAGTMMEGTVL
jgi:outer membrane protein, adhesin transport system